MKKTILTITMLAAAMLLSATQANKVEPMKSIPPTWCPPICR
jgi:hypothetical protein